MDSTSVFENLIQPCHSLYYSAFSADNFRPLALRVSRGRCYTALRGTKYSNPHGYPSRAGGWGACPSESRENSTVSKGIESKSNLHLGPSRIRSVYPSPSSARQIAKVMKAILRSALEPEPFAPPAIPGLHRYLLFPARSGRVQQGPNKRLRKP